MQDLFVRISAPRSCRTTCARFLSADLLRKISVSGSSHQGPVGPLVQDLCMRISCAGVCDKISSAGSCRSRCARSVYEDLLCKVVVSPEQDPVGLLVQNLCMRISRAYLCVRISCIRILYAHLCKISVCGSLVQDLSVRMSATRSCRTTDRLRKISFKNSTASSISRDEPTHTIPAKSCTSKSENATLPAFCAMDTRDLRRRLLFQIRKRNFTSIPCDRHARSPQMFALPNQKTQLYQHSAHSTPTISAKSSSFETMLQKYCPCHEITSRGHGKCCTGHAKSSLNSSCKNATPLRN